MVIGCPAMMHHQTKTSGRLHRMSSWTRKPNSSIRVAPDPQITALCEAILVQKSSTETLKNTCWDDHLPAAVFLGTGTATLLPNLRHPSDAPQIFDRAEAFSFVRSLISSRKVSAMVTMLEELNDPFTINTQVVNDLITPFG